MEVHQVPVGLHEGCFWLLLNTIRVQHGFLSGDGNKMRELSGTIQSIKLQNKLPETLKVLWVSHPCADSDTETCQ